MAFSILTPSNRTSNAQPSTTLPSARPATAPGVTAPSMLPDTRQFIKKEKYSQNERRIRDENEEAAEKGRAEEYSWMEDLRERIQTAMENADSENDFLEALEDEGVKARYGTSKRYGEYTLLRLGHASVPGLYGELR